MNKTYFVSFKLYNSENQGWAYKYELKTDDLTMAKQKYHELLKTYIGLDPFTHVAVSITDEEDRIIMRELWDKPESTVEESSEDSTVEESAEE